MGPVRRGPGIGRPGRMFWERSPVPAGAGEASGLQLEGPPPAQLPGNGHSAFAHTGLHVQWPWRPLLSCEVAEQTAPPPQSQNLPETTQAATLSAHPPASTVLGDNVVFPIPRQWVPARHVHPGPQPIASIVVRDVSNDQLQPRRAAIPKGGLRDHFRGAARGKTGVPGVGAASSPGPHFNTSRAGPLHGLDESRTRERRTSTRAESFFFLSFFKSKTKSTCYQHHRKHKAFIHAAAGPMHVLAAPSGGRAGTAPSIHRASHYQACAGHRERMLTLTDANPARNRGSPAHLTFTLVP